MQHGVLSVSVNFLALEPGIKKSKNQKPGGGGTKSNPDLYLSNSLFIKLNYLNIHLHHTPFMEYKSPLLILFSFIFMRPLMVAMVTAPKYVKYRHTKNQ